MTLYKPGQIIFVESDQAAGYKSRKKYHLCVCGHQSRYFFINSKNWEGSFRISHADFPALPKKESYIACNTLLEISDSYLRSKGARLIGELPRELVIDLLDHISDCDVLTEEEIEMVLSGLEGAI